MFDVGFSELLLLAVIALVVLGPEKLPHAARMTGAWVGRIRRMIVSVHPILKMKWLPLKCVNALSKKWKK